MTQKTSFGFQSSEFSDPGLGLYYKTHRNPKAPPTLKPQNPIPLWHHVAPFSLRCSRQHHGQVGFMRIFAACFGMFKYIADVENAARASTHAITKYPKP